MKSPLNLGVFYLMLLISFSLFSQEKEEDNVSWFKENLSIRKAFDGSSNENRPANFYIFEDHKSANDFFNLDLAVSIMEWEAASNGKSVLLFFPTVEWHKSTNSRGEKDRLRFGFHGEYYVDLGFKLKPYLLSNFALTRNFLAGKNEITYVAQLSFLGTANPNKTGLNAEWYLPGVSWRFKSELNEKRGFYYPYLGFEYNEVANLITDGTTESVAFLFARLHIEYWLKTKTLQLVFNGTYRNLLGSHTVLKNALPIADFSLNYYPGKQDIVSIGLSHTSGYDPGSRYTKISVTSVSLNLKY